MKVLLITNQLVEKKEDGLYCDSALIGTLESMTELGELYIVALKPSEEKSGSMPRVCKLEFASVSDVDYLRPMNRTIKGYFQSKQYNKHLLENIIPTMDLVVGYIPNDNAFNALKIAHQHGIPFLSFVVGCVWDSLHNHHRFYARAMAPYNFLEMRYTIKHSDYVHYVTKEFLQKRYPTKGKSLGCSDTNLRSLDKKNLENRICRIYNSNDKTIIKLVTTADIDVRYKGHEYVIKAISKLKQQGETRYRYHLIGAGKGDYLRKLCKQLDVDKEVVFLGRKKWNEVLEVLINSDVYLQPSLQEGLPRSVVEAMSVGLPCVGFKTGGMSEILEPQFVTRQKDVNGIIKCLLSLQDKDLYIRTAERNFQKAKEFERENLVMQIKSFFRGIRNEIAKS